MTPPANPVLAVAPIGPSEQGPLQIQAGRLLQPLRGTIEGIWGAFRGYVTEDLNPYCQMLQRTIADAL